MYESRKIMGDVCEDVSSFIKGRKDVLSEEHEHHRDSEPRPNEAQLHLSDAVGLGIENYVIRELRKVFPQEDISCKFYSDPFISNLVVKMTYCYGMKNLSVGFNYFELSKMMSPQEYIVSVCIQKIEEALKGVTK